MRLNLRAVIPALTLGAIMAMPSFATSISGTANIAGTVDVSNTFINFNSTFTVPSTQPPAMQTGDFKNLSGSPAGTIGNLTGGPATGPVSVPDFIMFTGGLAAPISFDLTNIAPGTGLLPANGGCTAVPGVTCTPFVGSPFTLLQNNGSVSASLSLDGQAYIGTAGTGSSMTAGIFTTQTIITTFDTVPGLLAQLNNNGVIAGQSYSASFLATPNTPTVPEPASLLLMGVGLLGAGIIARKKIRH